MGYIGQRRAIRLFNLVVNTLKKNVLLVGRSGYGKTYMAHTQCTNYIDVQPNGPPPGVLNHWLLNSSGSVLIADEIHTDKHLEDWPLFLDNFKGRVVFTTTNPEKLPEYILTRTVKVELEEYTKEEKAEIARFYGGAGAENLIAELCRGSVRRITNLAAVWQQVGIVEEFLDLLGVRPYRGRLHYPGEITYLSALEHLQPAGERVLKASTKLPGFVEVESDLLYVQAIQITPKGRVII